MAVKTGVLIFGLLSVTYVTYWLIGLINRRTGAWMSVFYCYAGSRNYIATYAPPGTVAPFRWRPSPIGVLRQGGRLGLVVASPVTEAEFLDPANAKAFALLQARLSRIARLMRVEMVNAAGILPGVLAARGGLVVNDSRPAVVDVVTVAVDQVMARELPPDCRDVIVVGGAGYLGAQVAETLRGRGYACHIVDPRGGASALPQSLAGRPCLLLDIARRGAIDGYVNHMWPGLVVLNETFPTPSRRVVARMVARGVRVFHLSGVAGSITPPLQHGYENAVPCCAIQIPDAAPEVRVIPLPGPRGA